MLEGEIWYWSFLGLQIDNLSLIPSTDTAHFDSEDDYRSGCWNVSHCQQESYSTLG